jgi:hypothetical protein
MTHKNGIYKQDIKAEYFCLMCGWEGDNDDALHWPFKHPPYCPSCRTETLECNE